MLSLKYKNIVKKALLESLTEEEVFNNKRVLENFLEAIKNFPHFSIGNRAYINEEDNKLNIYILTSWGDIHRYAGKKLNDGEIDISDFDFNPNEPYLYRYYNFSVFSLENHMGILSYDRNKIRYRLLFNYGQDKDLDDVYKFYNKFNKRIEKTKINDFVREYVTGVVKELNKIPVKTHKPEENTINPEKPQEPQKEDKKESKKIDVEKLFKTVDDPNLKLYYENDFVRDTDEEEKSEFKNHINQETGKVDPNFMYTDNHNLRLTATRLIGDEKYRTIQQLTSKITATLSDFNHYTSDPSELLASNVLYHELENISNGNGSNPIKFKDYEIKTNGADLHETIKYLSVDPNEIISPIAVLKMDNITWSQDANGNSAEKEIQRIFGDKTAFNNGIISFPATTNAPLVDSYALITYNGQIKQLGVSTKGGLNGKGANASLSSLFKFLLKDDATYKMNKWGYNRSFASKIKKVCAANGNVQDIIQTEICPHLSNIGMAYWNVNETKDLLSMLILFGGIPMSYHQDIINYAVRKGIGNLHFKNTDVTMFAEEASTKGLTDLVMDLLDKQKYKFCQVNTKPNLTNTSFDYKISVQYPAKFSGTVSFKKAPSENGLRFHISGD